MLIAVCIAGVVAAFGGGFFGYGLGLIERQASESRARAILRHARANPRGLRWPLFLMASGVFLVLLGLRITTQVLSTEVVLLMVLGVTLCAICALLFRRHRHSAAFRVTWGAVRLAGIAIGVFIVAWALLSTLL